MLDNLVGYLLAITKPCNPSTSTHITDYFILKCPTRKICHQFWRGAIKPDHIQHPVIGWVCDCELICYHPHHNQPRRDAHFFAVVAHEIDDAELDAQKDDVVTKRLMFIAASSLVTVGFWGVAFAWGRVGYLAVAVVCGLAALALFGGALEWPIRRAVKRHARRRRGVALGRIEDLNARIRQMERELKREEKTLQDRLQSVRRDVPGH